MHPYQNPVLPIEQRVRDLLERMSLEEKVAQLRNFRISYADFLGHNGPQAAASARELLRQGAGGLGRPSLGLPGGCTPRQTAELCNAIQKFLLEETRLGIPVLFQEEALHGLMARGATCFPQAIGLASSWNPALVERIFQAAALETRARGVGHVFTPVLDLARDPRWGRTEETYGEDPHLAARIGAAAIRGLQGIRGVKDSRGEQGGPTIDRQHVAATAKHFAAHGQPEAGTNCAPANIAERELREAFLKPFETAIREAGALTVMAAYNEINGIPAHVNPWLLRQVLRAEWGFAGLVISDGGGLQMLVNEHFVAADYAEAARKALAAGVQFDLSNGEVFATLAEQADGALTALIDEAAADNLRLKFRLGLFEHPYGDPDLAEQVNNCADHQALAYQAALEGLVLLKNEGGLLPLDPARVRRLAVIGPNARELHPGGYSFAPDGKSVLEGLRETALERGMQVLYAEGCRLTEGEQGWMRWWQDEVGQVDPASDDARIAEAVQAARQADAVLLVLGENETLCREAWAVHHPGDRDTLDLPGRQDELVRAVAAACAERGAPLAALLINGRPLSINGLVEHVPAILEGWYLGQATGPAVADVLFGAAAPGGRLPVTFPRSVGQLPAYYYHKPSARRGYLLSDNTPLFPFGHGLTYTSFAYANLAVSPPASGAAEPLRVTVEVTNTGSRPGDEVVQLYLRDCLASATRPVMELKGFQRIHLQPGETHEVSFQLTRAEMAFYDEHMQWTTEPGRFEVMVGRSAAEYLTAAFVVA